MTYTHISYTHNGVTIPEDTFAALQRYVQRGEYPGNFLQAVLRNDLFAAINRADSANLIALPAIAVWIYNYAPAACWGSEDQMDEWAERFDTVED